MPLFTKLAPPGVAAASKLCGVVCMSQGGGGGHLADLTLLFYCFPFSLPTCPFCPSEDGVVERSSPKSEIEVMSEPPEEKVTARTGASCPSGGHVADIYLANINK